MCCGPEVIPPTEKGMTYKSALKVIMIAQFAIVILNFIAAAEFLSQAIFGLFFILIIWMIQHQCSYQGIMIFIFFSIFFAVSFLIYFLTPIQNGTNPFDSTNTGIKKYIYIDSIISFVYYLFVMIFCFYPYREFKAIAFNENPALRNYF
jgi:ABC-type Mn2+/Zn2+ transport system permease subunit